MFLSSFQKLGTVLQLKQLQSYMELYKVSTKS